LVITKALSKSEEDYKTVQAHTALAERIRQRDPGDFSICLKKTFSS
jgi:DNA polymerase elongation subunit (family B)